MLLALVIVGGVWILFNHDQIEEAGGVAAFLQSQFISNANGAEGVSEQNGFSSRLSSWLSRSDSDASAYPTDPSNLSHLNGSHRMVGQRSPRMIWQNPAGIPARLEPVIRIASFKMNVHSTDKPLDGSIEVVSHLLSQFDVVAIQQLHAHSGPWIEKVRQNVAALTGGAVQLHAVTDVSQITPGDPQFAIMYNANTVELDASQWYSVNDPDSLLVRKPLVGWFRTVGVPANEAFTFTLVNLELDDHRPDRELVWLGDLFRAIRNDGRGEDDVIIAGNFNAGDRGLSSLHQRSGLTWVVYDQATSIMKDAQFDNLVFAGNATVEFTGQGGVFDFLAAYNLSLDQARSISNHMPVWAEFSLTEGGSR